MNNDQPLQTIGTYTIRVYQPSDTLTAFEQWYAQVFATQNPTAATAFTFTPGKDDQGEPVVELSQFHELLSIDALESLFYAYQDDTVGQDKSLIITNLS